MRKHPAPDIGGQERAGRGGAAAGDPHASYRDRRGTPRSLVPGTRIGSDGDGVCSGHTRAKDGMGPLLDATSTYRDAVTTVFSSPIAFKAWFATAAAVLAGNHRSRQRRQRQGRLRHDLRRLPRRGRGRRRRRPEARRRRSGGGRRPGEDRQRGRSDACRPRSGHARSRRDRIRREHRRREVGCRDGGRVHRRPAAPGRDVRDRA